MENKEIETIKKSSDLICWSPKEVIAQIQAIQQLMRDGMTEGEHWGKIPGCGDKPALLKPGAEKLGLMFRLAGKYEIIEVNLPNGHLDVKVKCSLVHIVTGSFWGEGLGSCSTMESKYRYRSGAGENTHVQVPKAYWDARRGLNPGAAQELIGGPKYMTKKGEEGLWWIYEKIDKVDNPDIADTYNTVRKIAKKRAFVDAMLSATAASDIFTQDIDEMFGQSETQAQSEKKQAIKNQEIIESQVIPENDSGGLITHDDQLELFRLLKEKNIPKTAFQGYLKLELGVEGTAKIKKSELNRAVEWIIRSEQVPTNG